jgi:hypothetical protein
MPALIDLRVVNGTLILDDEAGTELRLEFTGSGLDAALRAEANTVSVGVTRLRGTISENGVVHEFVSTDPSEQSEDRGRGVLGLFGRG